MAHELHPRTLGARRLRAERLAVEIIRETEFCGLRPAGDFRCRTRENGRDSVRRPRCGRNRGKSPGKKTAFWILAGR